MKESMNIQDKIKGALYGFAIGDAMGATTEFMTKDEIQSKYKKLEDIIGGGWLNIEAGNVTDDTEMSLCVMRVLIKNDYKNFKKDIACEFSKWLDTQPQDVGNQCMKAIEFYKNNNKYIYVDRKSVV